MGSARCASTSGTYHRDEGLDAEPRRGDLAAEFVWPMSIGGRILAPSVAHGTLNDLCDLRLTAAIPPEPVKGGGKPGKGGRKNHPAWPHHAVRLAEGRHPVAPLR